MSILLLPPQLADIERQKAEQANPYRHDHNPLNADFHGGVCPACEWADDNPAQPLYIVGEGTTSAGPLTTLDPALTPLTVYRPPAGWPAVGERVQCETCGESGWPGYVPADVSEMSGQALNDCGGGEPFKPCPNCHGEGSTLPRVELTVTCPWCAAAGPSQFACSGPTARPDGSPANYGLCNETCPSCRGVTHPDESIVCATCDDRRMIRTGTVPWGSALWQTLPVVAEHRNDGSAYVIAAGGALVLVRDCGTSNETANTIGPLDPASVRASMFVAILTDIEVP